MKLVLVGAELESLRIYDETEVVIVEQRVRSSRYEMDMTIEGRASAYGRNSQYLSPEQRAQFKSILPNRNSFVNNRQSEYNSQKMSISPMPKRRDDPSNSQRDVV